MCIRDRNKSEEYWEEYKKLKRRNTKISRLIQIHCRFSGQHLGLSSWKVLRWINWIRSKIQIENLHKVRGKSRVLLSRMRFTRITHLLYLFESAISVEILWESARDTIRSIDWLIHRAQRHKSRIKSFTKTDVHCLLGKQEESSILVRTRDMLLWMPSKDNRDK